MDEIWQRHKAFILQVFVGSVFFLVAFFVMSKTFGGSDDPQIRQAANAKSLEAARSLAKDGRAPDKAAIRDQTDIAVAAEKQKEELAARVASTAATDDEYVQENIRAVLSAIGDAADYDNCWGLYKQFRQACISRLREKSRGALVGRAAQSGKEIDELLGLGQGFQDDEIPAAIHGLAIVTDVVGRCLARERVDSVSTIRIEPRTRLADDFGVTTITGLEVHMEIVGDPAEVVDVLRSFNPVNKPQQKMVVLRSLEGLVPLRQDEDTVKAVVNLVGLRARAEKKAEVK
jgi:hypothetical protein